MGRYFRVALNWLVLLLFIGGLEASLRAGVFHVLPNAIGRGDGSDWNNAMGGGFGPERGSIYYIGGGKYGAMAWATANAATNRIIVRKATELAHGSAIGWTSSYGLPAMFDSWTFSSDYWTLDGQVGGGARSWADGYGFVITNNTSVLCTISGERKSIQIKQTQLVSNRGDTFIGGFKGTTGSGSDIQISQCAVMSIFGTPFHIKNWTNCIIEWCYVHANKSTAAYHSEAVSSIGINQGLTWRWNLFDEIEGTAVFAGVNPGQSDNWRIYGNLITRSVAPLYYYWEAAPSVNQNRMDNSWIVNNSIINCRAQISQGGFHVSMGTNNTCLNNLFYKNDSNWFYQDNVHDWSYASDNTRTSGNVTPEDKDVQILQGEVNGQNATGSPFRAYNDNPLMANFAAKTEPGLDTNALIPENAIDLNGRLRGVSGGWMRGAVEFDGVDVPSGLKILP